MCERERERERERDSERERESARERESEREREHAHGPLRFRRETARARVDGPRKSVGQSGPLEK